MCEIHYGAEIFLLSFFPKYRFLSEVLNKILSNLEWLLLVSSEALGEENYFLLFLFSPQELNKGKFFSSKYSKKQVIFSPSVSDGIALEYLKSTLANLS